MPGVLAWPPAYELKSRLASFGRRPVQRYLATLRDAAPRRVLDVACGPGRHARLFAGAALYAGIDGEPRYLRHAAARAVASQSFCAMNATRLGFADGAFDLVYAVGLFHHLPDAAVQAAAGEMRRVVRPGGRAVIVDQVRPGPFNPVGRLLCDLDRGEHVREVDTLADLLVPAGFHAILRALPGSYPYQRAVFHCTP